VFVARVKDCFGDNGLTALAIVRERPGASELDTFLLSCRVIGRGVETALLAFLCERARSAGRRTLEGRFVPTRKNAPAADFFARHGFRERPAEGEGTAWVADLVANPVACPGWIRMTVAEGALV
jgi:FkbH-like protein